MCSLCAPLVVSMELSILAVLVSVLNLATWSACPFWEMQHTLKSFTFTFRPLVIHELDGKVHMHTCPKESKLVPDVVVSLCDKVSQEVCRFWWITRWATRVWSHISLFFQQSSIYILSPVSVVSVIGCSRSTIVIGAAAKTVVGTYAYIWSVVLYLATLLYVSFCCSGKMSQCQLYRLHSAYAYQVLSTVSQLLPDLVRIINFMLVSLLTRIYLWFLFWCSNCLDSKFYIHTLTRPQLVGDNRGVALVCNPSNEFPQSLN